MIGDDIEMKIKSPILTVFTVYLLCMMFRFVEYFINRNDKGVFAGAFLHKLFGIILIIVLLKLFNIRFDKIGFTKKDIFKYAVYGLAFGISAYIIAYGVEIVIGISESNFQSLKFYQGGCLVDKNTSYQNFIMFFGICIIGDIINVVMEEGMFRGFFERIIEKNYSFLLAAFISSLLFGLWHFILPLRNYIDGIDSFESMKVNMLLFVVATAVMGFKFVLMTKLTGSLYMSIGDHFANNFIINILHVILNTGADTWIFIRILIAQLLSLTFVLIFYIIRNNSPAYRKVKIHF